MGYGGVHRVPLDQPHPTALQTVYRTLLLPLSNQAKMDRDVYISRVAQVRLTTACVRCNQGSPSAPVPPARPVQAALVHDHGRASHGPTSNRLARRRPLSRHRAGSAPGQQPVCPKTPPQRDPAGTSDQNTATPVPGPKLASQQPSPGEAHSTPRAAASCVFPSCPVANASPSPWARLVHGNELQEAPGLG